MLNVIYFKCYILTFINIRVSISRKNIVKKNSIVATKTDTTNLFMKICQSGSVKNVSRNTWHDFRIHTSDDR